MSLVSLEMVVKSVFAACHIEIVVLIIKDGTDVLMLQSLIQQNKYP
jgi:hypothetical protein